MKMKKRIILMAFLDNLKDGHFAELEDRADMKRVFRISRTIRVRIKKEHDMPFSTRDISREIYSLTGVRNKTVSEGGKKYRVTVIPLATVKSLKMELNYDL